MKENLDSLRAFLKVAETGSFTRAAAQMGVSQSALSHSIRNIETRLGMKLFHRTTRSISTTDAGERLHQRLAPLFDTIDQEIGALQSSQGQLRGSLRVNGSEHALCAELWPKFERFMQDNPGVSLELVADNRFIDIVTERFDAGIRLGDDVARDMIAVRVSPDMQMCVAASPAWLKRHATPDTPAALNAHECIGMRLPTHGGLLPWEFSEPAPKGKVVKIQPAARFTANNGQLLRLAALAGHGLIWTPRESIIEDIRAGTLQTVLNDWAISFPGHHLYYPNRRASSPLLKALVEALQHR